MMAVDDQINAAEEIKARANEHYRNGAYDKAVKLYSEAIEKARVPTFLVNRAAALMMLGKHREALEDCQAALFDDPTNVKVISRDINEL